MTDSVTSGIERPAGSLEPRVVRVLLVDDDSDVRGLIEVMLDEDERFEVVGRVADGDVALAMADLEQPDAVVFGLQPQGMEWPTTLSGLRRRLPKAQILVLSRIPDPYTLFDAVRRGADGCIDKERAWCELLPTLWSLCSVT